MARTETDEAEAILAGAPPELPPPKPAEPQKLGAESAWAEAERFADAVADLHELRGKPAARLAGQFTSAELREVADFLMHVAAAGDKAHHSQEALDHRPSAALCAE